MTDILKLAKVAHGPITGRWWDMDVAALKRFADMVRADQREKDAALCDAQALEPECPERAAYCADAIRSAK